MQQFQTSLMLLAVCSLALVNPDSLFAQLVEITGVPQLGQAGQVTGFVSGIDPATHRLSHSLYLEGAGWWTVGGNNIPINSDGSFSFNVGTAGNDEYASHYAVSVVPIGTSAPTHQGANTLNLGANSVASTYKQRYGTNLTFGGQQWGVKAGPFSAGPGNNVFSDNSNQIWVDDEGLHLTVQNVGGQWQSTEVILTEDLGYGTYMFKTNTRQDLLDVNATFGAFTWDVFGDDDRIPAWPNREIDFEDGRWGNAADPTSSQVVVQPWWVDGNVERIVLPDLSDESTLTRFFTWSPNRVEFYTLHGDHDPANFPSSAIVDHTVYTPDSPGKIVPEEGRENFRFNLWLHQNAPADGAPIEVVITDFAYTGLGDFDFDNNYSCHDVDALVADIAAGNHTGRFDLDGDGLVNDSDLTVWLAEAGSAGLPNGNPYLPGDANLDGTVDGQDFVVWNNHKFAASASWCNGDFDANGTVDGQDFIIWNDQKFSAADAVATVPEPAIGWSLLLLTLGALCRSHPARHASPVG